MSLGKSWKARAKVWRRATAFYETQWLQMRKRAEYYRTLSNASPAISVSNELDGVRLELATIQTLLGGIRADLLEALDEPMHEELYKRLHHMHTRIRDL